MKFCHMCLHVIEGAGVPWPNEAMEVHAACAAQVRRALALLPPPLDEALCDLCGRRCPEGFLYEAGTLYCHACARAHSSLADPSGCAED